MSKIFIIIAAAALAACSNSEQNTVAEADNAAETNSAPIVLPPAIAASKVYRCKDNELVYIDWLADNVSANVRATPTDTPTQVKAPAAGEPLVAEGYSLTGAQADSTITLARPGKASQSCKA